MSERIYSVFARNWWKENPSWPKGLEPDPSAEREYIDEAFTYEEAREKCKELNAEPRTAQQERLGYKWEFTS